MPSPNVVTAPSINMVFHVIGGYDVVDEGVLGAIASRLVTVDGVAQWPWLVVSVCAVLAGEATVDAVAQWPRWVIEGGLNGVITRRSAASFEG